MPTLRKHFLLFTLLLLGVGACQKKAPSLISFRIVDEKSFEMCFSAEVEGLYALVIKTKTGTEIKRAGRLTPASQCFQEQKMQHASTAYTARQIQFYTDSLRQKDVSSVQWTIFRRYYEEPLAEGVFQVQ